MTYTFQKKVGMEEYVRIKNPGADRVTHVLCDLQILHVRWW